MINPQIVDREIARDFVRGRGILHFPADIRVLSAAMDRAENTYRPIYTYGDTPGVHIHNSSDCKSRLPSGMFRAND
jgi:hypothetical protein